MSALTELTLRTHMGALGIYAERSTWPSALHDEHACPVLAEAAPGEEPGDPVLDRGLNVLRGPTEPKQPGHGLGHLVTRNAVACSYHTGDRSIELDCGNPSEATVASRECRTIPWSHFRGIETLGHEALVDEAELS